MSVRIEIDAASRRLARRFVVKRPLVCCSVRYPWKPSHDRTPIIEAPAGITFLGYENPPGVSTANRAQHFLNDPKEADWYNPIYLKAHERGGHFTAWENPDAVIEDIRATFRSLRGSRPA